MTSACPPIILVRHGHSVANERGIIISSLEEGVKPEWGLTARGRDQASGVVRSLQEGGKLPRGTYAVYSSPFSRARETAELLCASLASARAGMETDVVEKDVVETDVVETDVVEKDVVLAEALRERYFGEALEGTSSRGYEGVWQVDKEDICRGPEGGGESVMVRMVWSLSF
jgi:broad specificity phosphatase PhoE